MNDWKLYRFEELTAEILYNILALRAEVFIVEQECAYLDPDGKDKSSLHLCGFSENYLIAYARIIPPGIIYKETSIGRVLSKLTVRGKGLGRLLMKKAIEAGFSEFPKSNIRISAQLYLQKFYEELGFKKVTDPYLEDNIPHVGMLLINS